MTPSTSAVATKTVQRTVFDLQAFDNITLKKDVLVPEAPASLEDALAAVGNDTAKLLAVIHAGLIEEAMDAAREDLSGFHAVNEDGELSTEEYTGKFADEEQGKKINAAILSIAKLQGYEKSIPKEKKRELKEKAAEFLRSNPAMLTTL